MATNTTTINTISKTYAELKALRESSSLVPGQYYKITDFQTKWFNQATGSGLFLITSPVIEPLNVLAIATNKFSNMATSDLYPNDIIYYDFEEVYARGMLYGYTSIVGFKGWITRRNDMVRQIDIPYDWRHITVNCCRPDLSSVPEWSSTVTYNRYDVVKVNNKLYYCMYSNNTDTPTPNGDSWRSFTAFNEGLTYFPTDETFGFRAWKPDGNYLINLPADISTRTQKYIFDTGGAESSSGTNGYTNFSNVKIEGKSYSNIFLINGGNIKIGSALLNLIGANCYDLEAGNDFSYNIISQNCEGNKLGDSFQWNKTNSGNHSSLQFKGNIFISSTSENLLGVMQNNRFNVGTYYNYFSNNPTTNNIIDNSFYGNTLPFTMRRNIVGPSFYNNDLCLSRDMYDNAIIGNFYHNTITYGSFFNNTIYNSFYSNTINGGFYQNTIQTFCFNNTFLDAYYNTIGTQCHYNNIGGNFSQNVIGDSFSFNIIGANFFQNNIGSTFRGNAVGTNFYYNNIENEFKNNTISNYFRRNTIDSSVIESTNFSSSTHVYNNYAKRIFMAQSERVGWNPRPKLTYFNNYDVQTIALPTD